MEETIDLKEYIEIIKKNLSKILIITLSIGVTAGGIGLLSKEEPIAIVEEVREYQSTSSIIVRYDIQKAEDTIFKNEEDKDTIDIINRNLNYNKSLLGTYAEMLKSNKRLGEVINNLSLDIEVDELRQNINIAPVGESQLLNISVKNTDPIVAMEIANEIPKVFKHQDLELEVVDKAIKSTTPLPKLDANGNPLPEVEKVEEVKPSKIKKVVMNTVIGSVLGIMLSLFVVFLCEYMDSKLRTENQVQNQLGLNVLGIIPNTKAKKGGKI